MTSLSLVDQAAHLGIRLPWVPEPAGPQAVPRPPSVVGGPVGRPRKCDHDDRRPKVIVKRGRRYTTSRCRTCSTLQERERYRSRGIL